jgi:hypothetical protein
MAPPATSFSICDPRMSHPARNRPLSPLELERFGAELDALRQRTVATLGQRDADYIRAVVKSVRYTGLAGRFLLLLGAILGSTLWPILLWPACVLGTAGVVQDPREHGAGPQRHARPVRLDA